MQTLISNTTDKPSTEVQIRNKAKALGFDDLGFTKPIIAKSDQESFKSYISNGWHANMEWLASNPERRSNPNNLWPEVRSIVMVSMNYGPRSDPLELLKSQTQGAISIYAQGKDYHTVIKDRLKMLGQWIVDTMECQVKVFVDTAPVMEKPLAMSASLGWQGKHTNLVSRKHGSWLFLGALFTTLDLVSDGNGHNDYCGSCHACLDACPTKAFPEPYKLDANRCLSYLTIEHKDHIPREFRRPMANRIYGCDDCLAVCPWNKFAHTARESAFEPRDSLVGPRLIELASLDDNSFRQLFSGTAIKRTGRNRFVRNVLIALGNSGDLNALPLIEKLLSDPSHLVRAMAVWALKQLADKETITRHRQDHLLEENEESVRAEWLE